MQKKLTTFLGFVMLLGSVGFAQDSLTVEQKYEKYYQQRFSVSPFFWYLGLNGEILRPPVPSNLPEPPPPRYEVDVSFKDISNSLRFFIMLGSEFQGEKFIIKANITSLILEGEAITPFEIITQGINYRFSYLTSEITGGYRLIRSNKLNFNVLLGVRMLYTKISGQTNIANVSFDGERSVFWYDPIMALQLKYRPIPKLELLAYTDFGPIRNVDSYQIQLQGTFHFTKTFSLALGYRNYYINSEAEEKKTIYKGRVFGPFIRFGFQF